MYIFGFEGVKETLRPLHYLIDIAILLIGRCFFHRHSPKFWTLAQLPTLIVVQLAFRGYIHGYDTPEQLQSYEHYYIQIFVICFMGNYNTFMWTVCTFPLIHLTFYYFQLKVQLDCYYDPYTGKHLMDFEGAIEHQTRDRFVIFLCLNILFIVHTWQVQRDIITFAIKNHNMARQQS